MATSDISVPRELRDAKKSAVRAGWLITRTGRNHLKWQPPAGTFVITPGTPSEPRSIRNSLALLRKSGLDI